jgi:hypothetical protein
MDTQPNELGALAIAGEAKYELVEHDATHVILRNILQDDQYVVIDMEALPALASIFKRAAMKCEVY